MTILDTLTVLIVGDTAGLDKAANKSRRTVKQLGGDLDRRGSPALHSMAKGALKATGGLLGLVGAAESLKLGMRLNAEAESAQVAFKTLLGSAEDAKELLGDIRKFSAETPLGQAELRDAGRMLLAFGQDAATVVPVLKQIGDISALTGNRIGDVAEIYGKARVQGRLFAEDINQLTGRGIPIIQEFAEQLGVSTGEVKKLASEGKITFDNLETAFENMTKEGGKFAGGLADQAKGLSGQWSTFKDKAAAGLKVLTSPAAGAAKATLKAINTSLTLAGKAWDKFANIPSSGISIVTGLKSARKESEALDAQLTESNKRLAAQLAIEKRIMAFQEKVNEAARKQNELLGVRVNLLEQISGQLLQQVIDAGGNLLGRAGEDERAEQAAYRRWRRRNRAEQAEENRERRRDRADPSRLVPPGFEFAGRSRDTPLRTIGQGVFGVIDSAADSILNSVDDVFNRRIGSMPDLSAFDTLGGVDFSGVTDFAEGLGELGGGAVEDARKKLQEAAQRPLGDIGSNTAVMQGSLEAQRLINRQRIGGDVPAQQLKEQRRMRAALEKIESKVGEGAMKFLGLGTGGE